MVSLIALLVNGLVSGFWDKFHLAVVLDMFTGKGAHGTGKACGYGVLDVFLLFGQLHGGELVLGLCIGTDELGTGEGVGHRERGKGSKEVSGELAGDLGPLLVFYGVDVAGDLEG